MFDVSNATEKPVEFKLIESLEDIPADIIDAFPYTLETDMLDAHPDYWDEVDPPEDVELDEGEFWIAFPKDFSEQWLNFEDEVESKTRKLWTPDLIEACKKQNGVLFVVDFGIDMETRNPLLGADDYHYPGIFAHLRFESEADRHSAFKEIQEKYKNLSLSLS
jgi:hypothetical protein